MRSRLALASLVFVGFGIAAVGGCSLNPQPFPPGTYDGSADGAIQLGSDAAGAIPDGSPTGDDAEATDASEDAAAFDASDANDGDADDAADARDDVDDAGETG